MSGGDTMAEILNQLFRLEPNGKKTNSTVIATGRPAGRGSSTRLVSARFCRPSPSTFGMWSDGAMPLLFVCERRPHRYGGRRTGRSGFGPDAPPPLLRIAKEGRKYGVFLGPGDAGGRPSLDPTIHLPVQHPVRDADWPTIAIRPCLRSAVCRPPPGEPSGVRTLPRHREVVAFRRGRSTALAHDLQDASPPIFLPRAKRWAGAAPQRGSRRRQGFRGKPSWSGGAAAAQHHKGAHDEAAHGGTRTRRPSRLSPRRPSRLNPRRRGRSSPPALSNRFEHIRAQILKR